MGGKSVLLTLINQDYTLIRKGNYYSTIEHDSLIIDPKKDLFYWNSRAISGNPYTYLRKVRELDHFSAMEILRQTVPYNDLASMENILIGEPNEILVDILYDYGKSYRNYWYDIRGYTDETIDRFKLGYTGQYWVIPIYNDFKLKNFQCRGYDDHGNKIVRYYYIGMGRLPFNFDNLPDKLSRLYITESIVDAIILSQNGLNAVSGNIGAAGWDHKWSNILMDYKDIVICYDNDEAGVNGSLRTSTYLQHNSRILIWPDNFPYKFDITDLYKSGGRIEDLSNNFIKSHIARKVYT